MSLLLQHLRGADTPGVQFCEGAVNSGFPVHLTAQTTQHKVGEAHLPKALYIDHNTVLCTCTAAALHGMRALCLVGFLEHAEACD